MSTALHVTQTLQDFKNRIDQMTKQPHSLPLLQTSLFNTPLLAEQATIDSVLTYLSNRTELNSLEGFTTGSSDLKQRIESTLSDVAVIDITGPLTAKASAMNSLCGVVAYSDLVTQMKTIAADKTKHKVVLNIESGGGECFKLWDTCTQLKAIAETNNIELITYADGQMCSAAFAIGCIASKVFAHPESPSLANIGVRVALKSTSAEFTLQNSGETIIHLTSGKNKIPFKNDGSFKQEFLDGLQASLDATYQDFCQHVANNRPSMTLEQVKNTEASSYNAVKAKSLGLIDDLKTEDQLMDYLSKASVSATPKRTLEQAQQAYSAILATSNLTASTIKTPVKQDELDAIEMAEIEAEEKQRIANLAAFVKSQQSPKPKKTLADYKAPVKAETEDEAEDIDIDFDAEREARLSAYIANK